MEPEALAELDRLRWWLLRWGPRADSGVILARADGPEVVSVGTLAVALPVLALTRDFAPADMQYRMHRELLWDQRTGLWAAEAPAMPTAAGDPPVGLADATATAIDALATALAIGADAVPDEMRGRWQRQLGELRAALG